MLMSIYVTLGIFLLLAVRDPAANRSLMGFGGWANLAHAGVMAAQEYRTAQKTLQRASRASGEPGDDGTSGRAGNFLATSLRLEFIRIPCGHPLDFAPGGLRDAERVYEKTTKIGRAHV